MTDPVAVIPARFFSPHERNRAQSSGLLRQGLQLLLFVFAFIALCFAWHLYPTIDSLTFFFRREFGDVLPLYAQRSAIDLANADVASRLMAAVGVAVLCVGVMCLATLRRWKVWICLALAIVSVVAIDVSLAHVRNGETSFISPFLRRGLEYFMDVPAVNDAPRQFIANYAAISPTLSHHAGTHPPGGVLFLWVGTKLFGDGASAAAWWAVCVGALNVLPTYWLARMILGSARAGRVLPLNLVSPSLVIFGATSMDIVFLTFATTALATMFWTMQPPILPRPKLAARVLIAGVFYWLAAFMSFAAIILPILAGMYALARGLRDGRRARVGLYRLALIGLAFVFVQALAELLLGYDLLLVADAAMLRDLHGVRVTGYESFAIWRGYSVANLAAFAFGTGLALTAALAAALISPAQGRQHFKRRGTSLALSTACTLLVISISTLFTLETERVWLSVVPAMLVVAAGLRGWVIWWLLIPLLGVQTFLTECRLYTHW